MLRPSPRRNGGTTGGQHPPQGQVFRLGARSIAPSPPSFPLSHPSFPRKRESMSPRRNGGTIGGQLPTLCALCSLWLKKLRPPGRCLSPTPAYMCHRWEVAVASPSWSTGHRPAGEPTRIIMLVNSGGIATQPRAPGHERPSAASLGAAEHGRLSAATRAPGADIPRATSARAPGQYCQSAAPRAPGHGRPLAIAAGAPCRDRLSAALRAPDNDVPLTTTVRAPRHDRLSAAPIATAPRLAGQHRLRQESLPHTPATPNTLTYAHTHRPNRHPRHLDRHPHRLNRHPHRLDRHSRVPPRHSRESGNPRPPVATGGPQGGDPAHPALQVPPHPRSCSTAGTGFPPNHPSRAPPPRTIPLPFREGARG